MFGNVYEFNLMLGKFLEIFGFFLIFFNVLKFLDFFLFFLIFFNVF